jgi:serine/threonine protein kinase
LIGRVLGRGAFGKVNLCVHKLSEKLVAVKSLYKDYLKDKDNNEKIQNEINALKTIKHKNIMKLYEIFTSDNFLLMVMELCGGGDLLGYVRKRRKLEEPIAKLVFKQVLILYKIVIEWFKLLSL